jgi:hypothetical protein
LYGKVAREVSFIYDLNLRTASVLCSALRCRFFGNGNTAPDDGCCGRSHAAAGIAWHARHDCRTNGWVELALDFCNEAHHCAAEITELQKHD